MATGVPGLESFLMLRLSGTLLRYGVPGLARRLLLSPRVMGSVRHYNLGEALPPSSAMPVSRVAKSRK